MHRRFSLLLLLTSLGIGTHFPGQAQTPPEREPGPARLTGSVGAAVVAVPRYPGGSERQTRVFPWLSLDYGRFFFQFPQAGFRLTRQPAWQTALVVRPRFGFGAGDGELLEGVAHRQATLDGGLEVRWSQGPWAITFAGLTDLTGRSAGPSASAGLSYAHRRGRWMLIPRIQAEWNSSRVVEHFYGVPAAERRPGRPVYTPGSSIDLEAGILATLRLAPRWSGLIMANYTRFGDGIADSPLVEEEGRWMAVAGATWNF